MNRLAISLALLLGTALPLLIDTALKGVALLVLAGVAALALFRASAATRHLVWLFAAGALLVLPLLSALLPDWRVLPRWPAIAAAPAMSPVEVIALPTTPAHQSTLSAPTIAPTGPAFALPPAEPEKSLTLRDWLPLAWAAGFTLLFLRLIAAYCLLSRTARRCTAATDARLAEAMNATRRQLDIRRPVQLLLDSQRTIPMVWGLFRPCLVLPTEALQWDDGQLRSVLLHELAHVKRRDLPAQWLMQVACALHWFNPLVWFAAWRLHVESEHACDNLVLAGGVRASEYAEHVLQVATRLTPACGSHAAGLAMARPSSLEGRLLAVLNHRLNRRGISRSLMLMAVVLGLCVIIPVAMLRAADEKKIDAPTDDLTQVEQKVEAVPSPAVDAATVDIANDGSLSFEGRAMTLDALTNELKIVQCAADEKKTDPPADDLTQVEQKVEAVPPPAVDAVTVDIVNDGSLSFEGRAMTLDTLTNELKTVQRATPNVKAVIRASAGVASAKLNELLLALKQTGVAFLSPITRKSSPAGVPLEVARIHLRLVERELGQALAELARLTKLHSEKLISTSELDQARLKVERLKAESETDPAVKPRAELDLARAELAIAQARLKRILELASQKLVAQSDVEQAEAEFSKAQANLHLAELLSKHPGAPKQNGLEKTPPNQPKKDRLLKILADEIQVAESQAKLARAQHKAGTGTLEESLRAELDVLALKREIAALEGDAAQARDLLGQQMRLLQDLERDTRELRQRGRASEADELKVRRQILLLQRQQAELD